jgi:hypothetical protein
MKQDNVKMANFGIPRRIVSAKEEKPSPVNWRRGLFRVWLLLSAAWIMGWIIYLIMFGLHGGFKTTGDILEIPVVLFGPPVALLLFGFGAGWTLRGFKLDSTPPSK